MRSPGRALRDAAGQHAPGGALRRLLQSGRRLFAVPGIRGGLQWCSHLVALSCPPATAGDNCLWLLSSLPCPCHVRFSSGRNR